jgi:Lamin Tail Domain
VPSRQLIVSLVPLIAVAACAIGSPTGGGSPGGGFDREIRGGRLHAAEVPDFRRPDTIGVGTLLAAPVLRPVVGRIDPDQLIETGRVVSLDASRTTLVHVQLGQEVGGVAIHGAYLHLTARPATAGTTAHLVASSYHLFEGAAVDVAPAIDAGDATARARAALRAPGAPARRAALAIWPVRGVLHLVWEVTVDGRAARALVYANGARTGEVEVLDERIDAIGGTTRGWVAVGGAPGGAGTASLEPLPDLAVTAGTETGYTGADGGFALTASGGTVAASASGRAAIVVDAGGAAVTASAPGGAGVELDLGDGADEGALAQVTAYRAVTEERAFLLANDVPVADLGAPVTTNVNLTDTCNAYFSPADRSLNFFHSGGGCQNSAERSVVGHEYGHFVDDAYGGILDGGLSEGWGDVLSCLTRKDPVVGPDLLPGQIIRTCDNDYVYPASGSDEVHALGQAWSGFVWHVRAGLVADLGEDEGDALTRALVLPSLRSNAADIPAAVREVFLRDDDDGDLSNHTPHWDVLMAAAQRHGLDFVVAGDLTAPAAVTDLRATDVHAGSVSLAWTAPGDDGVIGTAAAYDLRWSTAPITESTFPSATPIPPPPPAAAGQDQALTFAIPPGEAALYVALRARDEAGNTSPLSNVLGVQPPAPSVVFDDDLEDGGAGWTASGLWHATTRRASSGTTAFWYGQDATGTYDTGGPNQGDLVSAEIDLAGVDHPVLAWREWLSVEGNASYDLATITVTAVDDPSRVVSVGRDASSTGGLFVARGLDLAALAGHRVQVAFRFDTIDGSENQYEGWYVDDVRVLADAIAPPPPTALVINEVLADPPAGYDANGDGTASTRSDEMIELVNPGAEALDLGGWTLEDGVRTRLTFGSGTAIEAGKALVVFGGGAPDLGGVPTAVAPGGLGLNNAGDTVRIRRPGGEVVAEMSYGPEGGHDQSLVRATDGDAAAPFVGHRTLSQAPASPGRRSDGSAW